MAPGPLIDDAQALRDLCSRLRGSTWLALDTEFIRERSFYAQLCLIQVANESVLSCVDPLAIEDLSPLLDLLHDPAITKVFHAASQDLEIFYQLRGEVPSPIFDTQIGAALLGLGEQISYGRLVQALLDIELDKSHTRTDWARRPLDPEQLRYAEDDVRYLRDLYRVERERLASKGRLDWLEPDFAALADPARYALDPEQSWRRVRGAQSLRPRQLVLLQGLAAWRERRAAELDKPRKWILQDDVLLDLARRAPQTRQQLAKIRGLDEAAIRRSGDQLLDALKAAAETPSEQWPKLPPRRELSTGQEALADGLMAMLKLCAHEQGISPTAIATRRDIEGLACGETDLDLLHGWRGRLVGEPLQAFLRGETALTVTDGALLARPAPRDDPG
jgi:ribonuclease D